MFKRILTLVLAAVLAFGSATSVMAAKKSQSERELEALLATASEEEAEEILATLIVLGAMADDSGSSKSSNRYKNASIDDAYWNFSNGNAIARWEGTHRSKGKFTVTLYRDGKRVSSGPVTGSGSMNFTKAIVEHGRTGNYYFNVSGKWTGGYTDSMSSNNLYVDSARLAEMQRRLAGGGSSSGVNTGGPGASGGPSSGPSGNNGQWENMGSYWRYRRPDGVYAAGGWEQVNGKWYCFDRDGHMYHDQWIRKVDNEHIWYYVGADGAMVTNTNVGGYSINANGECYY